MNRTTSHYDDDDDVDALLARRRRKRKNPAILVVAGTAVGVSLLAAGVLIGVLAAKGRPGPGGGGVAARPTAGAPAVAAVRPSAESDSWTHAELVAHLQKSGVRIQVRPIGVLGKDAIAEFSEAGADGEIAPKVTARRFEDNETARVFMGLSGGENGFVWGRWGFYGNDATLLGKIRDAVR